MKKIVVTLAVAIVLATGLNVITEILEADNNPLAAGDAIGWVSPSKFDYQGK